MSADSGPKMWIKFNGQQLDRGEEESVTQTTYSQRITEVNAGVDFALENNLTAGVNLRFATGATSISSSLGNSSISTEGFGVGGTLTWQGENGLYVDGQARYMSFSSDLSGVSDNNGQAVTTSVEVGREILMSGTTWSIVPQGQLTYSRADFDTFIGDFGETVTMGEGESLIGRLGVSVDSKWSGANGIENDLYGSFSLSKNFEPETSVDLAVINETAFGRSTGAEFIEVALGGTYGLTNGSYLYGNLNAAMAVSDADSTSFGASFGFRMELGK